MIRYSVISLFLLLGASAACAQSLALEECRISAGPGFPGIKARCGTMPRPLDPENPDNGTIELRVAVVPALNLTPEPDPLVPLAGGPGQGAVQFYAAHFDAFEGVRRSRDILLVDQRGTGESSRMDCPADDELIDEEFSVELTVEATLTCLEQLPHDPRFFTTSVAVKDLEAVRVALGYPSLNLYGVSYGTRVAQHFARRYPESTRTIVLDGVVPPQIALGPEIATEGQTAVDRLLQRCADDVDCAARFPNIAQTFAAVVAALKESPATIQVPDPSTSRPEELSFGVGEFAIAVRLLAYSANSIALLPLLISEAGDGNYVPMAAQFQMTVITLSDMLSLGMHNAVMCAEDAPFFDKATIDYDGLAASYMGTTQLDALEAICSVWPRGPLDAEFKVPLATDLPVLLLSGDADPITPPRYAEMAAVDFTNALHLIGEHQGHGQLAVGCMPRIVTQFIETASPEDLETECLRRSFIMPFFLDFSGPKP